MKRISNWQGLPGRCVLAIGLGAFASIAADPALAGCSFYEPARPPVHRVVPGQEGAGLIEAAYRPGSDGFVHARYETSASNGGIVGMWNVTFVSDGVPPNPVPEGVMTDFGTVQWHDDGTEIMISGGRPPSTGDVCMGVWEQTGPFTFKLKHIALAWVSADTPPDMEGPGPSPAQFLGQAVIQEVVKLNRFGDTYRGSFTIDQYNADASAVLVHISGTVTGTRVTVN